MADDNLVRDTLRRHSLFKLRKYPAARKLFALLQTVDVSLSIA